MEPTYVNPEEEEDSSDDSDAMSEDESDSEEDGERGSVNDDEFWGDVWKSGEPDHIEFVI